MLFKCDYETRKSTFRLEKYIYGNQWAWLGIIEEWKEIEVKRWLKKMWPRTNTYPKKSPEDIKEK